MKRFVSIAALSLASTLAFAAPVTLDGEVNIEIKPQGQNLSSTRPMQFKLPRIKLSDEASQYLGEQLKNYPNTAYRNSQFSMELPSKVNVGMHGTPVLNQGMHGSCVTFAVTAAIDATLGAGDYISQLCSLELGSWLAIHDKVESSGWMGTWGSNLFSQLMEYGIVSKNHQKYQGCAEVHVYPLDDENDEGKPMSEDEYRKYSIPVSRLIEWQPILISNNAFNSQADPNALVWKIKEELARGKLVTFAMALDVNVGDAGAVGSYKAANDTWMVTPQIIVDAVNGDIHVGHELVITGYDDNAMVSDDEGNINRGLFTLRNSWSEFAGDQGTYYVTYDHLKFFIWEAAAVQLKK